MKFTSLTTIFISAAAMAGVAIASEDLVTSPYNLPCKNAGGHFAACVQTACLRLSTDQVGCSNGLKGYNNGYAYGYYCGHHNRIDSVTPCSCFGCCKLTADRTNFQCGKG
ncbi:uncharacterized protein EDB93DRAFT_556959 [Suillus bovinus]|uniref:uncharacterized protein n=1 Tax=Suillus bovinus TaxID=48563 RepID=UPI001B867DF9|nr:uncharacterized protein EDB93DRAFT_556959 [Suillus bovinus]KAG2158629.1 hypothetical protein EDB93DRAFT_556959 [Suillus bovinus]